MHSFQTRINRDVKPKKTYHQTVSRGQIEIINEVKCKILSGHKKISKKTQMKIN